MPKVRVSKSRLWRAIRKFCVKCVGNSPREVELCTDAECELYLYRFARPLKDDDPVYLPSTGKYKRVSEVSRRLSIPPTSGV